MDKPYWKDSPEWASYLAQDEDGEWFWYECEPRLCVDHWDLSKFVGMKKSAKKEPWKLTMEPRP